MAKGTVRLFHSSRHYGFIRQDSGGEDVFVHLSAVRLAGLTGLKKGQRVSFEIFDNQGKLAARNLCVEKLPGDPLPADVLAGHSPSKRSDGRSLGDTLEDERILVGTATSGRFKMVRKSADEHRDAGRSITRAELEKTLTDAVKTSHADCADFVGVIVEQRLPTISGTANWAVKGVKFGRADRERCGAALSERVNQAQLEFQLSDT